MKKLIAAFAAADAVSSIAFVAFVTAGGYSIVVDFVGGLLDDRQRHQSEISSGCVVNELMVAFPSLM